MQNSKAFASFDKMGPVLRRNRQSKSRQSNTQTGRGMHGSRHMQSRSTIFNDKWSRYETKSKKLGLGAVPEMCKSIRFIDNEERISKIVKQLYGKDQVDLNKIKEIPHQ